MKCAMATRVAAVLAASYPLVRGATLGTPVERVVKLLEDLKERLESDEKSEQQVYDKFACWCEKTTDRKAQAIVQATNDLRAHGQSILTLKGKIATLVAEIEKLATEIEANKKAQEKATSIRQKENSAYAAETAEIKQAMVALQQAIEVLIEGTSPDEKSEEGASMLQASTASSAVKSVIRAMPAKTALKPDQMAALNEFIQASAKSKYSPQSFTIQGILTDMYSNFASDLETATLDEATANTDFENFINLKAVELKDLETRKKGKEEDKATNEEQLADTQQIYDDVTEQKAADVKFFDQTKSSCLSKHEDWTTRSSLREEEIRGVEEALNILSADDARTLFASAIKPGKETGASDKYDTGRDISFLQIRSVDSASAPVSQAFQALKKQATATHSLRLASLAVRVKLAKVGHFDEVLRSIDTMIQTLKDEDLADIEKRDQCKNEYQKIESTVKEVTWLIEKNVAKINKLEKLIEKRTQEKLDTIQKIADVNATMDAMEEQREAENGAFAEAKDEDQRAIDLLMAARSKLGSYYKNHSVDLGPIQGSVKGAAFAQQEPEFEISADQAPDAEFSGKGKRKNEAKGILQILTTIIEDLNDEIKNDMKAEEAAQLEHEQLMADALALRKELTATKVSLEEAISKRGEEKTEEETDKGNNEEDLNNENEYKASIKDDCDFIIRTFEKRAAARTSEMQGLVGAKEYLAGAMPKDDEAALLEKGANRPFDDKALLNTRFLGISN